MQEKFPREQELYAAIQRCAYKNHNQVANDAANIMFNYQKSFVPMCNPTCDQGMMKYLLELKGELPIQYKGQTYSIITSVGFPYIYPDAPAVLRIYNPDINKFSVNQYFIQGASIDQSVVNMNIPELASWYNHKSIGRVMVALIRELGQRFPFFDKLAAQKPQAPQPGQGYAGYNNPTQPQQPQQPQQYGNQYQQPPCQPQYPNNQYQQNNQYSAQPYNPYSQGPNKTQPLPQTNVPPQNYAAQYDKQLKDKCLSIIEPELNTIRGEFKNQKDKHDEILTIISEQEKKKEGLKQIERAIDQSLNLIQVENNKLQTFINEKDKFELNEQTVLTQVCEDDVFSAQVVDCASDIAGYRETFHFVLEKYRKTDIPYETFIKATRKIAEEQFNSVLLLKKCQGLLKK